MLLLGSRLGLGLGKTLSVMIKENVRDHVQRCG